MFKLDQCCVGWYRRSGGISMMRPSDVARPAPALAQTETLLPRHSKGARSRPPDGLSRALGNSQFRRRLGMQHSEL